MCRVRTRPKREASSQNLTRKTSHMLSIPHNFLNGFELISKITRGTSQSAEIRRSAEKCLCRQSALHACKSTFIGLWTIYRETATAHGRTCGGNDSSLWERSTTTERQGSEEAHPRSPRPSPVRRCFCSTCSTPEGRATCQREQLNS